MIEKSETSFLTNFGGILPYEKIIYVTKLNSSEVLEKLSDVTRYQDEINFFQLFERHNKAAYIGSIDGRCFKIRRVIHYKNSFLPRISGVVDGKINGSKVTVTMKLHPVVLIFMTLWLITVAVIFSGRLVDILNGVALDNGAIFIPAIMFIVSLLLPIAFFKYETIKSKKFLAELWNADVNT
ncbi:hypothetical protein [Neptunitalea lumnitzerae]|uniref:Uncharacterized protein n=1 Tax=Neptunitalea lumnitzerae TaxID=2965509 RepID=A0ABQ5MLN9_9FLAO|nr:hypothetical protein [Neptunitalea sp. Y10]GLB50309.1 hypothetical protein Y10_26770 [Neptunitalea sp. Y10]